MKEVINIHTGEVADRNGNAGKCYKIGLKIIESMIGVDIDKFIFKEKDRAVIMKSESSIKIDNEEIFGDPMLLFQQLIASVQGTGCDVDVETAFSCELCTFPIALSKNNGYLREADKPQLANALWKCIRTCHITPPNCADHVLDGGSLLHKVVWKKRMTYKEICKRNIDYVKKHYGQNCSVVFDRYSGNASTKDITHLGHSKGKLGRPVLIAENTVFNIKKDEFLLNLKNKQCFLEMLTTEMNSVNTVGMCAMQSGGDADTLIATTAVDIANSKPAMVIGEDTDLLILLIHFVNEKKVQHDVYFMLDRNIKVNPKYGVYALHVNSWGNAYAIHALLGCVTTSRVFSIGKGAALTKFQMDERFQQDILLFLEKDFSKVEIKEAGERLLASLYGGKANNYLDQICLYKFH